MLGLAFIHRLNAAGANILADFTPIHVHGCFLNIRPEQPLGALHGKAHVIARHRFLAADLTFSHNFTSTYKVGLFLQPPIYKVNATVGWSHAGKNYRWVDPFRQAELSYYVLRITYESAIFIRNTQYAIRL
jgi:hypothetical protein